MKESMQDMMELVVEEIDGIKREMYLEFGGNQKVIFGEINRIGSKIGSLEEWQAKQIEQESQIEK